MTMKMFRRALYLLAVLLNCRCRAFTSPVVPLLAPSASQPFSSSALKALEERRPSESRISFTDRIMADKEADLTRQVLKATEELEILKQDKSEDAKDFEAKLIAQQNEVNALRNLLEYHRRQYETSLKEKEAYIQELETYAEELEGERKSLRKLTGVAVRLVGSRIANLFKKLTS